MSLVERAFRLDTIQRRERLRNSPEAVDDQPINLRKPKRVLVRLPLRIAPLSGYPVRRAYPAPEDITRVVCEHYRVTPDEIQSPVRTQVLVRPRQVWAYLAKQLIGNAISFPQIARYLGRVEHTAQIHSINRITMLVDTDAGIREEMSALKAKVLDIHAKRLKLTEAFVCFDYREF
jgi:hypothetical protein